MERISETTMHDPWQTTRRFSPAPASGSWRLLDHLAGAAGARFAGGDARLAMLIALSRLTNAADRWSLHPEGADDPRLLIVERPDAEELESLLEATREGGERAPDWIGWPEGPELEPETARRLGLSRSSSRLELDAGEEHLELELHRLAPRRQDLRRALGGLRKQPEGSLRGREDWFRKRTGR